MSRDGQPDLCAFELNLPLLSSKVVVTTLYLRSALQDERASPSLSTSWLYLQEASCKTLLFTQLAANRKELSEV